MLNPKRDEDEIPKNDAVPDGRPALVRSRKRRRNASDRDDSDVKAVEVDENAVETAGTSRPPKPFTHSQVS